MPRYNSTWSIWPTACYSWCVCKTQTVASCGCCMGRRDTLLTYSPS